MIELMDRGLTIERQAPVPVFFKGRRLDIGYRIDLLVNSLVIVELKAVEKVLPVHEAQLLTYMKLAAKRVGLLLNFNTPFLRDSIVRMVL